MDGVRVRFAPSPTGYLHIGGARTAIYNWLFARKHSGTFILRIEDTDAERSTADSIQGILDGLSWLGISWDEGPYFQSSNLELHREAARRLIETGHAYRCFCTKEDLDARREQAMAEKRPYQYERTCRHMGNDESTRLAAEGRPFVVRFRVPEGPGSIRFEDIVYGEIERRNEDIEDFVILRSDGSPLYLLSNAVDDIHDRITHVIRGQDGLANTPRQILIYNALGAPLPRFAHMPLTLDLKKQKISKRTHGEVVSVQFYRERGFLPWALVNFLVLLGWHTADDREFFSKEELIEAFSLEGVSRANSIFNYQPGDKKFFTDPKAISINAHYIRSMPIEELLPYVREELEEERLWKTEYDENSREWFMATIDLIRARYHTTKDFTTYGRAYFSDHYPIEETALKKNILRHEALKEVLPALADALASCTSWETGEIERIVREFTEKNEFHSGMVINGIRAMITGQSVGPGVFDCMAAIGKERVLGRLKKTPLVYPPMEST